MLKGPELKVLAVRMIQGSDDARWLKRKSQDLLLAPVNRWEPTIYNPMFNF